jgi:hypothetical protein
MRSAGGVRARAFVGGGRAAEVDIAASQVPVKASRAMILLAPSTGMPAPQIAAVVRSDESHVRKVIHAFNGEGFDSLDPDARPKRPADVW